MSRLLDRELPTVTVVVLCYNTGAFVVEALDCVRQQTYPNIELIVVDDASTDDSLARIEQWHSHTGFPMTVVPNSTNLGIPGALNCGTSRATGKYVTWISDDLWDRARLELTVAIFEQLPSTVGVLFGDAEVVDASGTPVGWLSPVTTLRAVGFPQPQAFQIPDGAHAVVPRELVRRALFWRCFIPAPTVTIRADLIRQVGPHNENLTIEDLDYWLRSTRVCDFAFVHKRLVRYRVHDHNVTSGRSPTYLDSLREILTSQDEASEPEYRSVIRTHLREEAFRVATGLIRAGLYRKAMRTLGVHFVPNLQCSRTSFKQIGRLFLTVTASASRNALGLPRNPTD